MSSGMDFQFGPILIRYKNQIGGTNNSQGPLTVCLDIRTSAITAYRHAIYQHIGLMKARDSNSLTIYLRRKCSSRECNEVHLIVV